MIPFGLYTDIISVSRRTSTGVDSLNNPTYGVPTSGTGWQIVYQNIKCKLAFSGKDVDFAMIGERVKPSGRIYIDKKYKIRNEDRITTKDGVQWVVIGVSTGQVLGVVTHYEIIVQLP